MLDVGGTVPKKVFLPGERALIFVVVVWFSIDVALYLFLREQRSLLNHFHGSLKQKLQLLF